ncbi:MAG: hypothetical protein Q7J84_00030 [Sulfuricaulis sp.]|nr:hypothetical protein [Sulfuricaulis sp.]
MSAGFGGPSPGHLLAERWGVPVRLEAQSVPTVRLADRLPIRGLSDAPLVVGIDALFWHATDADCTRGLEALDALLRAREGKPLILGTVPPIVAGQGCRAVLNAEMERRCTGHCILVRLEGDLLPTELHPGREWSERVLARIYGIQARRAGGMG